MTAGQGIVVCRSLTCTPKNKFTQEEQAGAEGNSVNMESCRCVCQMVYAALLIAGIFQRAVYTV